VVRGVAVGELELMGELLYLGELLNLGVCEGDVVVEELDLEGTGVMTELNGMGFKRGWFWRDKIGRGLI